ncbi:thioredoxin family protein [Nocardioides sp. GY 10113]|uniref:thioredoxin family protein n=1 Tax=Nocardioides sp. GY 10113 TaxID=2569761 RepID=UPI0010A764AF|nr:thioredoxin family protein [Nocardioides sp. GY 10113]TIC88371.1 thioredoxin family protein [Nocardioides sp. GY 10113]
MTGIVVLALAVVVAVGFGLYRRTTDGAFRGAEDSVVEVRSEASLEAAAPATTWTQVAAALPDAVLGERATLVQFSSAFCAPCRTTRVLLADVSAREDGVVHLEVDAEQHLDLVRALDVRRTPTTLILDPNGAEVTRAAGAPRRDQVLAALSSLDNLKETA